jgi:hypothetical protein
MGLLDRFQRIKDPVRGSAQVVSTTRPPHGAVSGNCRMHLVVTVPGHPAFPVDESFIVRVAKWPQPGMTLPIEASQSQPAKFKIQWDEVGSWHDAAAAQSQELAARLNQPPTVPGPPHAPPGTAPTVMVGGRPATPEEVQAYEAQTGLDLDGDGRIAGGAPAPPGGLSSLIAGAMAQAGTTPPAAGPQGAPSGPDPDQRIAALERLVALRDAGALTEAEFEAEKARLLGG